MIPLALPYVHLFPLHTHIHSKKNILKVQNRQICFGKCIWKKKYKELKCCRSSVLGFAFLRCLVGLVEDLHQVFGHVVRFLWRPVITLQVVHCGSDSEELFKCVAFQCEC